MRIIPEIPPEKENFRVEEVLRTNLQTVGVIRRNYVEPAPIGTIVAIPMMVVGYSRDCDGSALARLCLASRYGVPTDPEELAELNKYPHLSGMGIEGHVQLDSVDELTKLAESKQ